MSSWRSSRAKSSRSRKPKSEFSPKMLEYRAKLMASRNRNFLFHFPESKFKSDISKEDFMARMGPVTDIEKHGITTDVYFGENDLFKDMMPVVRMVNGKGSKVMVWPRQ